MTADEIRTAIARLEATKLDRLAGTQVQKSAYPDTGSVEFVAVTTDEIDREILKLRGKLSALTGEKIGVGPLRPRFGSRF
ncbi:hypothetical protein [Methylobrevis pamukkalensis]|uniref:Uncharacterized protein n=1 Tax=Methylobrevis pamukkalensis TaxID=1439726 RepID=A0A1E3H1K3_9HYPH|nr:hypothetical protein [Methylobrevis pamukkalensis]ODN70209.1 hypothetical protein A6302_02483 [Methylobrevis pamukkalensis]